jgi:hypothetical protein
VAEVPFAEKWSVVVGKQTRASGRFILTNKSSSRFHFDKQDFSSGLALSEGRSIFCVISLFDITYIGLNESSSTATARPQSLPHTWPLSTPPHTLFILLVPL